MARFDVNDYIDVQERIVLFWHDHPDGAIITNLMSPPDDFSQCRYRAEVYRHWVDPRPSATGWAFELAGTGGANQTSHEENCETSAIGRAIANLGYATSRKDRPSRQEMEKVERMEAQVKTSHPPATPLPQPATSNPPHRLDGTRPATDEQLTKIRGTWHERDIQPNVWRAELQSLFRVEIPEDLTAATADAYLKRLEKFPHARLDTATAAGAR